MSVPDWLTQDWSLPIVLALAAAIIGIAINYVAQSFVIIAFAISSADSIPWRDLLLQPLVMWSGFHGAVQGFSVLITGLAWILVSFLVARRFLADRSTIAGGPAATRTQLLQRAGKTGFVYMFIVIVVAAVAAGTTVRRGSPGFFFFGVSGSRVQGDDMSVAGAIFVGFSAGAIAALIALARRSNVSFATLIGLRSQISLPTWWPAASAGARRTLTIGFIGMALFAYVAFMISLLDSSPDGKTVAASAFAWIAWFFIWAVLDVGGIFLVNTMRFFVGEQAVLPTGKPGWVYLSALIAFAAFFLGGLRAARMSHPSDGASAARSAVSTLALVIPALFAASLFWAEESGDDIIAAALFLPMLWGAASALGGLYHANQAGLPPGVIIRTTPSAPATPPEPAPAEMPAPPKRGAKRASPVTACPSCGEPVSQTAMFCSTCGTRLHGT